ncbi:MAG: hypothetical protein M9915_02955 [Rhizobacter sp.]|nr:hypothetical protein [Rhizobacter sp.]
MKTVTSAGPAPDMHHLAFRNLRQHLRTKMSAGNRPGQTGLRRSRSSPSGYLMFEGARLTEDGRSEARRHAAGRLRRLQVHAGTAPGVPADRADNLPAGDSDF